MNRTRAHGGLREDRLTVSAGDVRPISSSLQPYNDGAQDVNASPGTFAFRNTLCNNLLYMVAWTVLVSLLTAALVSAAPVRAASWNSSEGTLIQNGVVSGTEAESSGELSVNFTNSEGEDTTYESPTSTTDVTVTHLSLVSVRPDTGKRIVTPGDTGTIPIRLTNEGNGPDTYSLTADFDGGSGWDTDVVRDVNGDSDVDAGEPVITRVADLASESDTYLILRVHVPAGATNADTLDLQSLSLRTEDPDPGIDTHTLNVVPDTGGITVDTGASYTRVRDVHLDLPAISDVVNMKLTSTDTGTTGWIAYSSTHDWTLADTEGTHTVSVQYEYDNGQLSDTFTDSITLDKSPPSVPALQKPSDGSDTSADPVPFDWSDATDTGSGVQDYRIQVATDSGFSSLVADSTATGSDTSISLPGDTYHWRVRSRDNAGNTSAFPSADTFTIDRTGPTVDGSSTQVSDGADTLSSADLDGDSTLQDGADHTIRVQVDGSDTVEAFYTRDGSLASTSDTRVLMTNRSGTRWTGTLPDTDTAQGDTVNIVFRASDRADNTTTEDSGGQGFSYGIEGVASNSPPSVTLTQPDDGSPLSSDVSGTYTISDPEDASGTVSVEVSYDSGATWFDTPTVSGSLSSVSMSPGGDTHGFTWDSRADVGNRYDTRIQLRIRASDGSETGTYDVSPGLEVDNDSPTEPGLKTPANGSETTTGTVSFDWTDATDTGTGIRDYRIQVATDTGFTSIVADSTTVNSDTTLQLPDDLYYWHVRARDAVDNTSTFTATDTFVVNQEPDFEVLSVSLAQDTGLLRDASDSSSSYDTVDLTVDVRNAGVSSIDVKPDTGDLMVKNVLDDDVTDSITISQVPGDTTVSAGSTITLSYQVTLPDSAAFPSVGPIRFDASDSRPTAVDGSDTVSDPDGADSSDSITTYVDQNGTRIELDGPDRLATISVPGGKYPDGTDFSINVQPSDTQSLSPCTVTRANRKISSDNDIESVPSLEASLTRIMATRASQNSSVSNTLELVYDATDVAPDEEENLRIYKLNESKCVWEIVGNRDNQSVDEVNDRVEASTKDFSFFRVAISPGVASDLSNFTVAPNPFRPNDGDRSTGRDYDGSKGSGIYFLRLPARVEIQIYNIHGSMVDEFRTSNSGGRIQWNVRNKDGIRVASGYYLYRVVDLDTGKVVTGKLAVIR